MDLATLVSRFVSKAKSQPANASDPSTLRELEQAARMSRDDRSVALYAPIAEFTYDVKHSLAKTDAQTARKAFKFPFRVEIVAIHSTVVLVSSASGTNTPTRADLEVALDLNFESYLTSSAGVSPNGNAVDGGFVSLDSFDLSLNPRLIQYRPQGVQPEIGFSTRWAVDPSAATGRDFRTILARYTLFARRLPEGM